MPHMTKQHAMAEAQKRWGTAAACRYDPAAPLKAARDRATRRYVALSQTRTDLEAQHAAVWKLSKTNPTRQARLDALRPTREAVQTKLDALRMIRTSYPYGVGEHIGIGFMVWGKGDTWEEAFANADATHPATAPDVRLQPAATTKRRARLPQEQRSRSDPTPTIPPATPVTGHRCQDCGTSIRSRSRCPACAVRDWRQRNRDQKRAQDRRYREKNPKRVRALVRARVAQWRKRNRITSAKGGA